jgi:hypothetical protein
MVTLVGLHRVLSGHTEKLLSDLLIWTVTVTVIIIL